MRLIVLDKNFDTLGAISVFNTLIWTSRYYATGVFELHMPADLFDLLSTGKYLYRNDSKRLGVIREVNFSKDNKGARTAYCKGYFAEDLLNARVIDTQQRLTGKPGAIGRALVDRYFISPSDKNRVISNIKLGAADNLGESVTVTVTGDNVGDKLFKIEKTQEMSHRLAYDYLTNDLTFEVWKGKDRTDAQTENSWAIFSDSFYNVKNAQYNRDDSSFKNFAYVAGEGEGSARMIVTVDLRASSSEERRELYVDARDLQSTYTDGAGMEHSYTASQYKQMLRQRGLEKLAEYEVLEVANSDVDPNANLVYGVDFDLGDLCTYRYTDINIECTKRITEIQEVFEGSKRTLSVVFGAEGATSITKLIKREVT
jgi:hypothetical protein